MNKGIHKTVNLLTVNHVFPSLQAGLVAQGTQDDLDNGSNGHQGGVPNSYSGV